MKRRRKGMRTRQRKREKWLLTISPARKDWTQHWALEKMGQKGSHHDHHPSSSTSTATTLPQPTPLPQLTHPKDWHSAFLVDEDFTRQLAEALPKDHRYDSLLSSLSLLHNINSLPLTTTRTQSLLSSPQLWLHSPACGTKDKEWPFTPLSHY